jgi:hypothetical protein
MSSFNLSDLELLSNRKKLTKYFDKEKLSQNIQIEQIICQINNISKNDQNMPINLELNNEIKKEMEIIVNAYNNLNQLVKEIKITDGRFFIENLIDEIVNQAVSKAQSVEQKETNTTKVLEINTK